MNYLEILKQNIEECYTKALIKNTLKELCEKNIIAYKENLLTHSENVFVFDNHDSEPYIPKYDAAELITALDNRTDSVLKVLLENEFDAPYTYAALFSYDGELPSSENYGANIIRDLLEIKNLELSNRVDNSKAFIIENSKLIQNENNLILKFPLRIRGYLPRENDNRRDILYNIICMFNKERKSIEIRYNQVKSFISSLEDNFYVKRINETLNNLSNLFNIEITPVNMSPIIKYIKTNVDNNEESQLVVSAQALNYATGSKAVLDTGNNDDMILPFIGNLKNILTNNATLFDANDETKEIKQLLEEIILEAEYLSDHPWITLAWPHEVKSKILKIKFLFNYLGQDYSVLQYYGNVADAERMSYVTQFIFDNKRAIETNQVESNTATTAS